MDLIQKNYISDLKEHFKDYDKEDLDIIIKKKIEEKTSKINLKYFSKEIIIEMITEI